MIRVMMVKLRQNEKRKKWNNFEDDNEEEKKIE